LEGLLSTASLEELQIALLAKQELDRFDGLFGKSQPRQQLLGLFKFPL